jgi:hypothetical protein
MNFSIYTNIKACSPISLPMELPIFRALQRLEFHQHQLKTSLPHRMLKPVKMIQDALTAFSELVSLGDSRVAY